jgi:hypothetical protein
MLFLTDVIFMSFRDDLKVIQSDVLRSREDKEKESL